MIKNIIKNTAKLIVLALLLGQTSEILNAQDNSIIQKDKPEFNWALTLAGAGTTSVSSPSNTVLGGEVGLGHTGKILFPVEFGGRQSVGWDSVKDGTALTTKLYLDVFPIKFSRLEIGAGVNAGTTYGNLPMAWSAAPEGVVRLFIKKDVGIYGRIEYPFDLHNERLGNSLSYSVGLCVRF